MKRLRWLMLTGLFGVSFVVGLNCGGSGAGVTANGGAGGAGGTNGGGTNGGGASGANGGGAGGANAGGTAGTGAGGQAGNPAVIAGCSQSTTQCSDGADNDGDNKIDTLDPECVSPCDNDEGSFGTGVPGDNLDDLNSCKQDCFFDGNSGADEGCQHNLKCDPLSTYAKCGYDQNATGCTTAQTDACRNNCHLTPNGCDCFGCCAVPGQTFGVRLQAGCTFADVNDATKCTKCTVVTSCENKCEPCEVCVGKPMPDPGCMTYPDAGTYNDAGSYMPPDGGMYVGCTNGAVYCGPGSATPGMCPATYECVTGCCLKIIQ